MVMLTATDAIVSAVDYCAQNKVVNWPVEQLEGEPSLQNLTHGSPVTHSQIIALSRCLREHFQSESKGSRSKDEHSIVYHLDGLLRGAKVYTEPPKPKKEPTSEFKALMARLREEEEALAYERMMNPPSLPETLNQRFSAWSQPQIPSIGPHSKEDEDEVTFADINRQMTLIINVLVSIIACSVAIWMAASHWSTPKRLGLSMGGSGVVGIAEVVVYAGYLRRVKEAKDKERKKPETKEIIGTWVIESDERGKAEKVSKLVEEPTKNAAQLRKRSTNKKR